MRLLAVLAAALLALSEPPVQATPAHTDRIESKAQFDALARTSPGGRYASFPQVMFAIDRAAQGGPRLYFINSRRFEFHLDFVQRTYLSTQDPAALLEANYSKDNRRFLFGSVLWYPTLKRFGVEFWEGDRLTPELLTLAMSQLQPRFHAPLAFKANSAHQLETAAALPGLQTIDANALFGSRDALVLNAGKATGKLRIIPQLTKDTLLAPDDIAILGEAPLQLSPVAGLITSEFSTPLAHVNLLAKSWRIPNGYIRDAVRRFADLEGKWVRLEARGDAIVLRAATPREIAAAGTATNKRKVQVAKADLAFRALPSLGELRARDSIRVGAKAANLGEVARGIAGRSTDFSVPPGFAVPFAWYQQFVTANGLDAKIAALLADPRLRQDAAWRRAALTELRQAFAQGTLPDELRAPLEQRRREVIGTGGVFVRSSTNSEDLPGFNGAGLYSSVPNVVDQAGLEAAVRTVWGSVWNDAAFAAREAAGIDHLSVKGGVLVQLGMNAEASGVMITENPFDPAEPDAVFINAKRGLGIRVVEGRRVAEQLLHRSDPEAIQLLTRSTDDAMLTFDANGGVREVAVEAGRVVLTDERARRLAKAGQRVARIFGSKPQDIEWLLIGDAIHIVQSRPYLRGN
jgi:hypothetical protein